MLTRGMKKAQKAQQKHLQKQAREQEARARAQIDEEDATYRLAEETRLKENEAAVDNEVQTQYNQFLVEDEAAEAEAERVKMEESQGTASKRVENLKAEVQEILREKGENKVNNEEVMGSRERYLVVRDEIGVGQFGKIYKARDPSNRELAVKVTSLSADRKYIGRYVKTFPILRYLVRRPAVNVLRIYEIFAAPDKAYVFMDQMEKTDLLQKIKKDAPFTEQRATEWIIEIGKGLAHLHSIGVAHENLQASSILFDATGRIVLGGLGSCAVFHTADHTRMKLRGSSGDKFHHHLAPERLKDDDYDPDYADIWSFGVLYVVMLTKEWPFEKKHKHRRDVEWKLAFKMTGKPLTDKAWTILTNCFVMEPERRASIFHLLNLFQQLP